MTMVYRASVHASYDSALYIPGAAGPSGRTHGHRYTVEAVLETEALDDSGFVADFDEVQPLLSSIARELDHQLLNELEPFRENVPSAERQAEFFYRRLRGAVAKSLGPRVRVAKIRITQEPDAWAEFEP